MNDQGHTQSLECLMDLYKSSSDTHLNALYDFYNNNKCTITSGTQKTYKELLLDGIIGADYPSTHECNDLVSVETGPCADPIIAALTMAIGAWQNESTSDMLSRLYHFRHYQKREGVSLFDDPLTLPTLLGLSLVSPVYVPVTTLLQILTTCPACLGSGRGYASLLLGIPNNYRGDCWYCGGDGKVFENIVRQTQEFLGYFTGCSVVTAFGVTGDIIAHKFQSAQFMYSMHRKISNQLSLDYNTAPPIPTNDHRALIFLGYALHFLQDVASIPHHTKGIPYSFGHANYEAKIDYNNVFNSLIWQNICNEYNNLINAITFSTNNFAGTALGALFTWVTSKTASIVSGPHKTLAPPSRFSSIANSLVAGMHYVLEDYYNMYNTNLKYSNLALYNKMADYLKMNIVYINPKLRKKLTEKKKISRQVPNKAALINSRDNWMKSVVDAQKSKKPVPMIPQILNQTPIIIKTEQYKVKDLLNI